MLSSTLSLTFFCMFLFLAYQVKWNKKTSEKIKVKKNICKVMDRLYFGITFLYGITGILFDISPKIFLCNHINFKKNATNVLISVKYLVNRFTLFFSRLSLVFLNTIKEMMRSRPLFFVDFLLEILSNICIHALYEMSYEKKCFVKRSFVIMIVTSLCENRQLIDVA